MLAPTLPTTSRLRAGLRIKRRSDALDLVLLGLFLGAALLLFFDGGAETLIGAALGAAASASRQRMSGAFAGLFAGALFAGFLHDPIERLAGLFF